MKSSNSNKLNISQKQISIHLVNTKVFFVINKDLQGFAEKKLLVIIILIKL